MANNSLRAASHGWLRFAWLFFALLAMPALGHAKNNCPWMNEATATGLLGGEAVGEFTAAANGQPAVCVFSEKDAAAARTLRISVMAEADGAAGLKAAEQTCGTEAAPIQAIGNEAMICSADDRKGPLAERVVGRVRDQVFTITMGSSIKGDLLFTRAVLKTKIYTAAEQVSGNLF